MPATPADSTVRDLLDLLSALPGDEERAARICARLTDWPALLHAAEHHGVAGLLLAWIERAGARTGSQRDRPAIEEGLRQQRFEAVRQDVARDTLRDVLAALAASGVTAVALKGPLLGMRLYGPGVARPSTDLDVLLAGAHAIEAAARALVPVGYTLEAGPTADFFRAHHHHVHALHPMLPAIELHFDAYRGFGTVLPAAPLVARSIPCELPGFTGARLLSPEDEFLYLAVHAAGHRFRRLGWLVDLKLLTIDRPDLRWAQILDEAARHGVESVVAFTCELLTDWLGVPRPAVLRPLSRARAVAAERLLPQRPDRWTDAAASHLYTAVLCDGPARAATFLGRTLRTKLLHEWPMRARTGLA